jgi:hypothetical protein
MLDLVLAEVERIGGEGTERREPRSRGHIHANCRPQAVH